MLVAPLGIDRPVEPNLNDFRQSVEEVVVLTCSSGAAVKRLGLITHSIIVAAKKDPDISWRWIHLGEGIEQIKPILEMCPKNLNVELPGPVSRLEVFHYHRDHKPNVFVNLSSSEGVPITVMEAMSMGTPVVATAAGGTGDIVDAEVGVLLPVEIDSASVATSILHVVETSESKRVAAIDRWQKSASSEVAQAVLDFVIPKLFIKWLPCVRKLKNKSFKRSLSSCKSPDCQPPTLLTIRPLSFLAIDKQYEANALLSNDKVVL